MHTCSGFKKKPHSHGTHYTDKNGIHVHQRHKISRASHFGLCDSRSVCLCVFMPCKRSPAGVTCNYVHIFPFNLNQAHAVECILSCSRLQQPHYLLEYIRELDGDGTLPLSSLQHLPECFKVNHTPKGSFVYTRYCIILLNV